METFITDAHKVRCGELNDICGQEVLVEGKPGTTKTIAGNLWGVWAGQMVTLNKNPEFIEGWWDAGCIRIRLLEKDPIKKMVRKHGRRR